MFAPLYAHLWVKSCILFKKYINFRMLGLFFIVWNSLSCTAEYNSQSWSLTFWSKHHFESTLLFCGSFFLVEDALAFLMYNKCHWRLTNIQTFNWLIPSSLLIIHCVFCTNTLFSMGFWLDAQWLIDVALLVGFGGNQMTWL